jgi:GT2 family glycosyltransferase
VSALIVSYNVRDFLLETLRAYYATCRPGAEVVVVDNASSDASADAVASLYPQAILVRLEKNVGFGAANNIGLERCSDDYILLLNPDVTVEEGCVATLSRFLDENPRTGAAGPRLERPDGRLDLAARRSFPSPLSAMYRFLGLSRMFRKSARFNRYNLGSLPLGKPSEIDAGTAACLMVRRAAIDEAGFFDTDFFMYGEDLDLCFRIKEHGWSVYYVPDAVAVHVKGTSTRQDTARMLYEFHRAMWLFHRKHYAQNSSAPVNGLIWLGIWSRWALLRARNWLTRNAHISQ